MYYTEKGWRKQKRKQLFGLCFVSALTSSTTTEPGLHWPETNSVPSDWPSHQACTWVFNVYFYLESSWLTKLCSFEVYSKVIQLYIHVSILFQILFPFRLLQNIEQSSLCYTVGPCWLSVLNITVCTCQSQLPIYLSPNPKLPPWSP